ncbi:hypothetical protein GCM10027517_14470 [Phycicoccus ginsengisoli]
MWPFSSDEYGFALATKDSSPPGRAGQGIGGTSPTGRPIGVARACTVHVQAQVAGTVRCPVLRGNA